tara:strand:- start:1086 stop:1613 length:528 start_codon:yes stop_codon:yes gene_type:complete
VLLALAVACGGVPDTPDTASGKATEVPRSVLEAVETIVAAAGSGDPERVAALAHSGFEFDFSRPDLSLLEHLMAGSQSGLLGRLELILGFSPGRRLSPYGNGTIQELWIYPGLALDAPEDWSGAMVSEALERGLFSPAELEEYRNEGAYLGYSAGLTPEGDWIFFTPGRVSLTPR